MKEYKDKMYNDYQGKMDKDYQPGMDQFAGKEMGKTNQYMERTDKSMVKAASQIKKQAYKGRYD